MALEHIEGVTSIGGFNVTASVYDRPPKYPIYLSTKNNFIGFRIQSGPIKEVGVNGCQLVTLMEAALMVLENANKKYPCKENQVSIVHLGAAIKSQHDRTKNKESRGVEGTNKL